MTLDLEEAREALDEAIDRLNQKMDDKDGPIWEADPEKAAILQAISDRTEIAENHRCLDLQYQLDSAEAEIERLRADLQACGSYVGIGPNEGDLPVPERVRRCVNRLNGSIGHYDQKLIAQAAKITELGAALVEERARGNHYGMSYEEAVSPDPIERWIINGEIDAPKIYIDRVRDEARRQLIAEGKIGNGDHFPDITKMVWQVTEERKAAIAAMSSLRTDIDCPECGAWLHFSDIAQHGSVLQAMLQEAEAGV